MRTLKIPLIALLLFVAIAAEAQVKLGVKVSPGLNTTRIKTLSTDFQNANIDGKSSLGFNGGIFVDYELSENYYFNSGVNFSARKFRFEGSYDFNQVTITTEEEIKLQYVQVPISLKLYTNEVALDKKVYFQVGATADFKVQDDYQPLVGDNKMNFFDTSLLIASGMEMTMGSNTTVFGGISFNRHFLDMFSDDPNDFSGSNSFIGLEIGVKF